MNFYFDFVFVLFLNRNLRGNNLQLMDEFEYALKIRKNDIKKHEYNRP